MSLAVLVGLALAPASAVQVAALPGLHAVELCVAVADAAPGCGPAEGIVDPEGNIHVRVSDVVYRLAVQPGEVDVIVMHGTMQIDEFLAAGGWNGTRLQFLDKAKGARYDVRFPEGSVRTRRQDSR